MVGKNFHFTRRDTLIALVIIAFAFVYRMQIIVDRAANDHIAFTPPAGSDQNVYYLSIQGFREGTFPPSTFFFQPGMSYLLIAASQLMRTDNPGALRVFLAALASINCGVMMAAVRLLFGRRDVSILAALLLALYPVGAFFDTDFVIVSQAVLCVTWLFFGVLWLWRFPRNWTGAVLAGLSIGGLALMRRELVALGPMIALWILWQRRQWSTVAQILVAAVFAGLVILPIAWHNRAGGADYLITPVSNAEIYRGNSREARGDYRVTQATATSGPDYIYNLWQDVLLSPRRFIELELHKVGMYLSPDEPGNNISYVESGKAVSPVLQANPLDFRVLAILFLFGLVLLWPQDKPSFSLLVVMALVMMGTTLLIWVEGRIRTPVIVAMIPSAAYALIALWEAVAVALRRRQMTWPRVIPLFVIALVVVAGQWVYVTLPNPVTVSALPPDVQPSSVVYDGALELVGWKVDEQYSRAGIIEPFNAYVVSVYWKLLKPVTANYQFSLAYYVDGKPVIAFDHPIGGVAYPELTTSQWQAGLIYVDHLSLAWKKFDGPINTSGDLLLVVYPEGRSDLPYHAEGAPHSPLAIRIAQPAIIWGNGKFDTLVDNSDQKAAVFGDKLLLKNWSLPTTAEIGKAFSLTLGWQTTAQPIERSYSIGVYAFDANGAFVAQSDSPPQGGRLLTSSLPVNYRLEDTHSITLNTAGTYTINIGVYDNLTNDRLPVPDSSANLVPIGTVTVR